MSNSYKLTVSATYSDGSNKVVFNPPQVSTTPTNFTPYAPAQSIGTTAEAIATGDLTSPKQLHLKNLDSTNSIDFGYNNSGTVGPFNIPAGQVAVIGIKSGDTVYAKANTAACKVQLMITDA